MKHLSKILICVFLIVLLCGCVGSVNKYSDTYSVGNKATIGNIDVTLTKATESKENTSEPSLEDKAFLTLSFTVKSKQELLIDADTYFLAYHDGELAEAEKKQFLYDDDSKKSVSCLLIYKVPADWEIFEINYEPAGYYGGSNHLKFMLKGAKYHS